MPQPSNHDLSQIVEINDEFESAILRGVAVRIEDHLDRVGPGVRKDLFRQLLSVEFEHRLKAGRFYGVDEFLQRFPEYHKIINEVTKRSRFIDTIESGKGGATRQLGLIRTVDSDVDIESTDPFASNRQIGPYYLVRRIGAGGMGEVWLAEQEAPVRRQVALKLIKGGRDHAEVIARFEAERQALAMMDHPSIASVYDAGETDDGMPYFVMEFVKGVPITEYCHENRLSINDRLFLFTQVCNAVQHAHQKGIIHRDLKPFNVLVCQYDGVAVPKVIDFGLAKATQASTHLTDKSLNTEFGQVIGTILYMSPEQAELKASGIDTRTDVYGLGVMLYELLTGSTPIPISTLKTESMMKVLELIRESDPPRPSHRVRDSGDTVRRISAKRLQQILKGDLDWIVMKSLEKDRERRYATARDLAQDIERFYSSDPVSAHPPTFVYRANKLFRKHKLPITAAACVLAMLIAGLIGTGTMWIRASIAESDADIARGKAIDEAKRAQDAEADAKFQLADARWESNQAGAARQLLGEIAPTYRGSFRWRYNNRRFLGSDITLYGHQSSAFGVCFSPDGTKIASCSADQTVKVWDAVSGAEIATLRGPQNRRSCLCFSPDGTRIASGGSDHAIVIWDVATGAQTKFLTGHTLEVNDVCFSPDGKRIASSSYDETIKVWDARTGTEIMTLAGHKRYVRTVSFSPDGKRIASGSNDAHLKVWDAATGRQVRSTQNQNATGTAIVDLCFSPDGFRIAYACGEVIKIVESESGRVVSTLLGHSSEVTTLSYSPDGSHIASGSGDNTIRVWRVDTGVEIVTLRGHSSTISDVGYNADGSRIASASWDNTVKVWDAVTGTTQAVLRETRVNAATISPGDTTIAYASEDKIKLWDNLSGNHVSVLEGHSGIIADLCYSPDGTQIASGSWDDTIKIWDTANCTETRTLSGHTDSVNSVCFSPDGSLVASTSRDNTIKIWDAQNEAAVATLEGHNSWVTDACFSPNGLRIAAGDFNDFIKIWDPVARKEIATLKGHSNYVLCVCYSPDGSRLVSGSEDNTIRVWDTASNMEIATLRGHLNRVNSVRFNRDGSLILSGSADHTIRIWDTKTWKELASFDGREVIGTVSFCFDDTQIVATGRNTVAIYDAATETETRTLTGHTEQIKLVRFSSDGTRIYSESEKRRIVWDTKTAQQIPDAQWPKPLPYTRTSPDGRWLVMPSGTDVLLIDQDFKKTSRERTYREVKASPSVRWHKEQAAWAEKKKDLFASVFHETWFRKLKLDSAAGKLRILNNYSTGRFKLHVRRADQPKQRFKTFPIGQQFRGEILLDGEALQVGGDWQLEIEFENGVCSKPRTVSLVADHKQGCWTVKATHIFSGKP